MHRDVCIRAQCYHPEPKINKWDHYWQIKMTITLSLSFLALLVVTSRAYAIPRCLSVRPSVCPSGRLSVCKQLLLPHLLWGYLSQRLLYSPSLLALWCSCAPAIVIMILSPGAQKGGVAIFPIKVYVNLVIASPLDYLCQTPSYSLNMVTSLYRCAPVILVGVLLSGAQ